MNATKTTRRLPETKLVFCACGHVDYIHSDKGKGACEGIYTPLDGDRIGQEPCGCPKFAAESRRNLGGIAAEAR